MQMVSLRRRAIKQINEIQNLPSGYTECEYIEFLNVNPKLNDCCINTELHGGLIRYAIEAKMSIYRKENGYYTLIDANQIGQSGIIVNTQNINEIAFVRYIGTSRKAKMSIYRKENGYYTLIDANQIGQSGIIVNTQNINEIAFVRYIGTSRIQDIISDSERIFEISTLERKIIVDNVQKGIIDISSKVDTTRGLLLFGTYSGSAFNASGRIYYLKIYDDFNGEVLLRNYIPALDERGIPCLYDLISEKAFYNAGTGELKYVIKS